MPRADRISLTADGLRMPNVDQLSNKSMLNVVLDRHFAGLPARLSTREVVGLFNNLTRLTDKSLREYDAARAELLNHLREGQIMIGPYLRAIDHMENCISAVDRAVLNAQALRERRIGGGAPRLTERQEERLAFFRNAIEHSDERLLGITKSKRIQQFAHLEPFSIRLANTSIVIGSHVLNYRELVAAMAKCHKTIEVIRGVPTGDPGPKFPNAILRTTDPSIPAARPGFTASDYLKTIARLGVTHA